MRPGRTRMILEPELTGESGILRENDKNLAQFDEHFKQGGFNENYF